MAWDRLLDQLARVMPPGTSLETLQANGGAGASPTHDRPDVDAVNLDDDNKQHCLEVAVLDKRHASATGAAPTGFVVTGSAGSQATVARALDRLALIPALSDVTLQSTKRADVAGKQGTAVHDRRQSALHGRDPPMKDKLTPKVVAALAMLAVAAVALVGWFGLVSPQRSTASDLDRQIVEAQTQLAVAKGDHRFGRRRQGKRRLDPRARTGNA